MPYTATVTHTHNMCHNAKDVYRAQIHMAYLVRIHASKITLLFRDVLPTECYAGKILDVDQKNVDRQWSEEVKILFMQMHSDLVKVLHCPGSTDCKTPFFLHTMHHVAHMLRHSVLLFLWTVPVQRIFKALAAMVHGKCISPGGEQEKLSMCSLFLSGEKQDINKSFSSMKKELNQSLCQMSADYLSLAHRLSLPSHHPRAALDTASFKEMYDIVINTGDKRPALLFLSTLPEMMGYRNMAALLEFLSMHMQKFLIQVVKRTKEAANRKFIRLHFAAAGRCTCHAKCSVFGKVDDIQVLAVCKTCRNSPVFRQEREPRCRRTISSTGLQNVCTVDGNTVFIYIPLYRAIVNKRKGQLIYEHWAYTLSFDHVGSDSGKSCFYMLCAGGRRSCTKVFLTDSLSKTKCQNCRQGYLDDKTCLTAAVGNRLAALCDGCIIAACCPLHAPLRQSTRDLWLSLLECFTKDTLTQ